MKFQGRQSQKIYQFYPRLTDRKTDTLTIISCYRLILASVQQHWRSARGDRTRVANSKFEEHRRLAKKNIPLRGYVYNQIPKAKKVTTFVTAYLLS